MGWLLLSPPQYTLYIACWAAFCFCALVIVVRDRKHLGPEWRAYKRFLFIRWKLALFIPAFIFVTFAGRFTDDETWDTITGSGMSILTFLTAPWAIGLFYQTMRKQRPLRYIVVSLALCLFSSSWFYDIYILWRDGEYSTRWLGNLILSPITYIAAGLLWNLEATANNQATFSFLRNDWPSPPRNVAFHPLFWACLPFVLVGSFVLMAFVKWYF